MAVVTGVAYLPGLSGPFVFDDYVNIVNTPLKEMQGHWWAGLRQAALGGSAGPLGRPLSTASFWLNAASTGMNPFWFKLTNLFIHILNGWLVWRVCRRLIGLLPVSSIARDWLPLAATGIWLPECAYRPAYVTDTGRKRPGIEHFLRDVNLKVFFSETHTITGGKAVGVAGGDVIGPYGEIKRQLAKYFPEDADAYYDIKDPVCDALMAGALEWAKFHNWMPGPSEA
jgi:hypothetical protein